MAERKTEVFGQFATLHPEARFVFIGDSGEGDVDFAEEFMGQAGGPARRAALIHDVVRLGASKSCLLPALGLPVSPVLLWEVRRCGAEELPAAPSGHANARHPRLRHLRRRPAERCAERCAELCGYKGPRAWLIFAGAALELFQQGLLDMEANWPSELSGVTPLPRVALPGSSVCHPWLPGGVCRDQSR